MVVSWFNLTHVPVEVSAWTFNGAVGTVELIPTLPFSWTLNNSVEEPVAAPCATAKCASVPSPLESIFNIVSLRELMSNCPPPADARRIESRSSAAVPLKWIALSSSMTALVTVAIPVVTVPSLVVLNLTPLSYLKETAPPLTQLI